VYWPIAFLIFLAANCSAAEPGEVLVSPSVHTHGFDLSDAERLRLEQKAADGDASAAMRLWDYYAIEHHSDDLISSDRSQEPAHNQEAAIRATSLRRV
jgi:hypothetical protein